MRHRVLHFLWSGGIGGAQRSVYQHVREEMRLSDWEVGVVFGRAEGPWAEAMDSLGCEVLDLQMRSSADLVRVFQSVDRIRDFDIHHFHVLELSQLAASARCRDAARVFTQRHGAHVSRQPARKKVRRLLGGMLLRRYVHALAGNTVHAARYAATTYGLQDLPAQVTYNGIDFSLLKPTRTRSHAKRALGIPPDAIVLGSSGTFKAWKRFGRLVDLLAVFPDLHVLLVGDGLCRQQIERQAKAISADSRLHITGIVQSIADYLRAIDIFVLPSTADESFGNSLVEAMALGIPSAVFSDSPGICEHISNGQTGYVLRDQEELASTVGRLSADPELRSRVGEAAAQYVRSTYTLENMHEAYKRLYQLASLRRDGGLADNSTDSA